jgi:aryl-alcohol dehydrogenase-like predicted oxidoreductase
VLVAPAPGAHGRHRSFVDIPDVDPVFDFSRDGCCDRSTRACSGWVSTGSTSCTCTTPMTTRPTHWRPAFPTLIELREQGVIGKVGCGMNQVEMLARFVERVDLDCLLLAGRYTLLDRQRASACHLRCAEAWRWSSAACSTAACWPRRTVGATFDYAAAPPELVERAQALQAVCAHFDVPLPAAALQFVARHPAVTNVLVGARSAAEIEADVRYAQVEIPDELWAALDARLPSGGGGGRV